MFEKITSAPKKTIEHAKRCRGRYAATAGFIAGAVVTRKMDMNTYGVAMAFLEEKGLRDEFFNAEI